MASSRQALYVHLTDEETGSRGWWLPQGHSWDSHPGLAASQAPHQPTVKALLPSRLWESLLPSLHFSLQCQKAQMLRSWCLQNLRWPVAGVSTFS